MRRIGMLVCCLALVAAANDPTYAADVATCTTDCMGEYPDVSCTSSTTCTAVSRNCSIGQRGYVTCGSSTFYCQTCPICTPGTYRWVTRGTCCQDGSRMKVFLQEQCSSSGQWVRTGAETCSGKCEVVDPLDP